MASPPSSCSSLLRSCSFPSEQDPRRSPTRKILGEIAQFQSWAPPALPYVATVDLRAGDRILLCSDGLHGVVEDASLAQILGAHRDPDGACDALIGAANDAGGPDNITAVVIDIAGTDAAPGDCAAAQEVS
jgi:PPM family protein phosphatase